MGDLDTEFQSTYLKASEYEVGTLLAFTIASMEKREFKDDKTGETVAKWVLGFKESKQLMTLNKSNGALFKKLFGSNSQDWIGKPVKFIVSQSPVGEYFAAIEPKNKPASATM